MLMVCDRLSPVLGASPRPHRPVGTQPMPHPRWWTLAATTAVWLTTVAGLPAQGRATKDPQTPSHLFVQGNPAAAQQAESLLDRGLMDIPELRSFLTEKVLRDYLAN